MKNKLTILFSGYMLYLTMGRAVVTQEERQKIKNSLKATRDKRKSQVLKTIELKVNCHHTSKQTYSRIYECFKQAKWVYNDMLAYGNIEGNNIFDYEYTEHKEVTRFDKEHNVVKEKINLYSVYHGGIVKQIKTNITNLHKAKIKGRKVGRLKFVSQVNSLPIRTGSLKIIDNKRVTIPNFKKLYVYGLEQLNKYTNYEIANSWLICKANGVFIKLVVCINKYSEPKKSNNNSVGLDFGIKTNIVTSDGDTFDCNVQESEQLIFLQKQLHRKQEGSKRYYKLRNQIKREYEHLSNKRTDSANKLVHFLKTNYDLIYFQDEQISKWGKRKRTKSKKYVYSFGKQIQHSYLGRVKAKLYLLEKDNKAFMISRFAPTTKYCPKCECINTLTLKDRIYQCECGYSCDRDVHAARNVKLFGSTKRAECLEQASAEMSINTNYDSSAVIFANSVNEAKIKILL